MLLSVTADKITIKESEQIESGEYNTTLCQFEFTEEYDDLIKTAVFTRNKDTYKMDIIDNQCYIPDEVLQKKGSIIIGVYGYKIENDTLILRYSPKPIKKTVVTGSYVRNSQNSTPPTPTQFEQYEQALADGLSEVSNIDIDARKVDSTSTITITNREGETKQVKVYDGLKGDKGDKRR